MKTNNNKLCKLWKNHKEDIIETLFGLIFIGLFAFLVSSVANNWSENWQTIFMILILICSLIIVAYPLFKKQKSSIPELMVIGVCVLLLLISVIVFASVATGVYREPIIQISASFTGGLMALYGVGLTIKHNRLAKESDDILKAKPNIFPIGQQTWKSLAGTTKLERNIEIIPGLNNLKLVKGDNNSYSFAPIYLANSDLSMCVLKGIVVNDTKYIVFKYDVVLLKGSANCFKLDYCFELKESIGSVRFVAGDMLGNIYSCLMSFDCIDGKKNKPKQIRILGTLKTNPLDKRLIDIF